MIDAAFRHVMREALTQVAKDGLPGDHHFYITFNTNHPGVEVPAYLRAQYPNEMTIVLQFQFFGLEVTDEGFSVTLSFGGVRERIVIPFDAISTFADPSVNFALQFQPADDADTDSAETAPQADKADLRKTDASGADTAEQDKPEEPKRGQVVALDAFRKK
ncbi:MAG TPA: ClpXP protease specificity-enhancing factor SspB [Azospirillaceae bacterium]|nr:ClpXP protease specificity-enhancing factor SspB [Azospirillaceae bacterium]